MYQYFIIICSLPVLVFYIWYRINYNYWKKMNVPTTEGKFPFGHIVFHYNMKPLVDQFQDLYKEFRARGEKHFGVQFFTRNVHFSIHPEVIKNILTRDFDHFINRGLYHNEEDDPLSAHLLSVDDAKWRNLRVKLTPTFTSGKMKMMFQTVVNCTGPLVGAIEGMIEKQESMDVRETLARFSTDVIGDYLFFS